MPRREPTSSSTVHESRLRRIASKLPDLPFFAALTAPYSHKGDEYKLTPNKDAPPMVHQTMELPTQGDVYIAQLWEPKNAWKWAGQGPLTCVRQVIPQVGRTKAWYGIGLIGRENVPFLCTTWPLKGKLSKFLANMAFNKTHLSSLHGRYVSPIIGVYSWRNAVNVVTELPHHVFWMSPSPDMPYVLKKRVIMAYESLHACGVLHGRVSPDTIAIGGDGRVTLLDFEQARALQPERDSFMKKTTVRDLSEEMRRVRYMLDFEDTRDGENIKLDRCADMGEQNQEELERSDDDEDYDPKELKLEDYVHPPVEIDGCEWIRGCSPTRFVVPGTSVAAFTESVQTFLRNLQDMERQSDFETPSRSPSPSVVARLQPARNTRGQSSREATDGPSAQSRYDLRKRKEPPSEDNGPSKRMRTATSSSNADAGPSNTSSRHGVLKVHGAGPIDPNYGKTKPARLPRAVRRQLMKEHQKRVLRRVRQEERDRLLEKARAKRKQDEDGTEEGHPNKRPRLSAEGSLVLHDRTVAFSGGADVRLKTDGYDVSAFYHFAKAKRQRPRQKQQDRPRFRNPKHPTTLLHHNSLEDLGLRFSSRLSPSPSPDLTPTPASLGPLSVFSFTFSSPLTSAFRAAYRWLVGALGTFP